MPGLRTLVALGALVPALVRAQNVIVQSTDPTISYGPNGTWYQSEACGGTSYAFGLFQSFSYEFVGTAIKVVGTTDLYGGYLTITIDGQPTKFNRYSTAGYDQSCNTVLYSNTNLAPARHTLTVQHTNDIYGGTNAADQFFEWQYLEYTPSEDRGNPQPVSSGGANGAAIGGGVAGGIVLLIAIVAAWWFFVKRKRDREVTDLDAEYGGGAPAPAPPMSEGHRSNVLHRPDSTIHWPASTVTGGSSDVAQVQVEPWVPAVIAPPPPTHRGSSFSKDSSASDFNPYNLPPTSGIIMHPSEKQPSFSSPGPSTASPGPSAAEGSVTGSSSSRHPLVASEKGGVHAPSPGLRLSPEIRSGLPPLSDPDLDRLAARVASMITSGQHGGAATVATTATSPSTGLPPGAAAPERIGSPLPEDAPPQYTRD